MIKLFKPYTSWRARWYAFKVLCSTQLAEGPVVKQFEKEWAEYFKLNPRQAVAVNSGTSALEIAYDLVGLKKGDEIITTVLTCTATNIPLARRGVKIVFADINRFLLMDEEDLKRKITKKTKAIVYVDFGGASNNLEDIRKIATEKRIPLIQDSAQSFGPFFRPMGDFVAMSFQAIKTLNSGDGGMLYCKDPLFAGLARKMRWYGYDRELKQKQGDTDLEVAGYKMHMNDIAAAIGLGNLRSIHNALRARQRASLAYYIHGSGLHILCYPWLTILIHPRAMEIKEHLKKLGVETGQHHYRNDKYKVFAHNGKRKNLPTMDLLENQYLLLPYHHDITPYQVGYIIHVINKFIWNEQKK